MADQRNLNEASLLGIPPELRLIIYKHYLVTFTFDFQNAAKTDNALQVSLLNICQLIRREALPLYKGRICDARRFAAANYEACRDSYNRVGFQELPAHLVQQRLALCRQRQTEFQERDAVYEREIGKIEELEEKESM